MDELLREFLTETIESLDLIDAELVRFERGANNAKILDNIFHQRGFYVPTRVARHAAQPAGLGKDGRAASAPPRSSVGS
jgi:hypothetical protein